MIKVIAPLLFIAAPALAEPFGLNRQAPDLERCHETDQGPQLRSCPKDMLIGLPSPIEDFTIQLTPDLKQICAATIPMPETPDAEKKTLDALTASYGAAQDSISEGMFTETTWHDVGGFDRVSFLHYLDTESFELDYVFQDCGTDD